jgi:hypothetical protein
MHAARIALVCLLAMPLAGCTGGKAATLEGAVIPEIPVYAPTKVVSSMGYHTGESFGDLRWSGIHWDLETADPVEKVFAFYEGTLPAGWTRQVLDDPELDHKTYALGWPGSTEAGEYVQVAVYRKPEAKSGKTKIVISECVKKEKRGETD